MVGKHWTYQKDGKRRTDSFKINRWFGLGRILFHLFYWRQIRQQRKGNYKIEERFETNKVIAYVRYEDCKFGEPINV